MWFLMPWGVKTPDSVDIVHCTGGSAADDSGLQGWMYFRLLRCSLPRDTQDSPASSDDCSSFLRLFLTWASFSRVLCLLLWSVERPPLLAAMQCSLVAFGASCPQH